MAATQVLVAILVWLGSVHFKRTTAIGYQSVDENSTVYTDVSDPDCKINKTDKFVHPGDLVNLTWTLNSAKILGSTGYIFGHVTPEPSARCNMKAQRLVTLPLETKKKTCPLLHVSAWQQWCFNATDVSLTTNPNRSITFRITFPVESILKYNLTTDSTILFAIRLHWNGPSLNGSELVEYIVAVHILDRKRPETSTADPATPNNKRPETSTADPATPTVRISSNSPTSPAKSGNKGKMSGRLIAVIISVTLIAAILVAVVLLCCCCYRSNANFKSYCHERVFPCFKPNLHDDDGKLKLEQLNNGN